MKTTFANAISFTANVGSADSIWRNKENTVCSFQAAQNIGKDADGNKQCLWHKVKAFANGKKPVDLSVIKKGALLLIEGRLALETFENKEGVKVKRAIVVADSIEAVHLEGKEAEASEAAAPDEEAAVTVEAEVVAE